MHVCIQMYIYVSLSMPHLISPRVAIHIPSSLSWLCSFDCNFVIPEHCHFSIWILSIMSLGPKQNIHCICVSSFLSDPNVLLIKKNAPKNSSNFQNIFVFGQWNIKKWWCFVQQKSVNVSGGYQNTQRGYIDEINDMFYRVTLEPCPWCNDYRAILECGRSWV